MSPEFSHLAVEFLRDTKFNKRLSEEKGRKIFDDVEKVKIRIAGDPKNVPVFYAHEQSSQYGPDGKRLTYAELHAGLYEAFKRGLDQLASGTPLSEVTFVTPAKAKELSALNVETVEQLAQLDGANLQRLGMGARELKEKAEAFLIESASSADYDELTRQNAEMAKQIAALKEKIEGSSEPSTPAPVTETTREPTPFDDWDKETIELWFEDNKGKFDKRWSVDTARQEATKLNAELAEAAQ